MESKKDKLDLIQEGSYWFKRIQTDLASMSPHFRIVRIRYGFFRIYWKEAYMGEMYKEMSELGYDITDTDMGLEDKSYDAIKMDDGEIQRKIKNFVEGYWEVLERMKTKLYMMRHDYEFYKTAIDGYKQMRLK